MAYLYVSEGGPGVVAESAHLLARVPVVVRVAAVRRVEAEVPALLGRVHFLVHRVYGLEDPPAKLLELAQLDGLFDAVVLQVVVSRGGVEGPGARHRQPVHVGQLALPRGVQVVGRSTTELYC